MKKLLIVAVMALAVAGYGQGEVNFANSSTSLITTNVNGVSGNMSGAGNYRIGLYAGPLNTPAGSMVLVGSGLNSPLAGRFNGNPTTGFFALPAGFPSGTQIDFQVRAWLASAGANYETAFAAGALAGTSALGRTTPGGGTVLPGTIFGSSTPDAGGNFGVGGFQMTSVVPEPSSIALGLLGLGAIALFRRRK